MTDFTLAAKVPTLDIGQSMLTGQRFAQGNLAMAATQQEMQSRDLDMQSKSIDLGEKQQEVSALQAYRANGGGNNPKALDALKNYPDQVLKVRQAYAAMDKLSQDKLVSHLGMLGEAARTVAALPDGSPEQKAEWDSRLDHLHANGVITDNQWQSYKKSGPSALVLNQVMQFSDQGHAALGLTQGAGAIDTTGMSPEDASRASRLESIAANSKVSPQERDIAKSQLDQMLGSKAKAPTVAQNIAIERMVNSEATRLGIKATETAKMQDLRATIIARATSGKTDNQLLAGAAAGTQNPNWTYAPSPASTGDGLGTGNFDSMFSGNTAVAPQTAAPVPINAASAPPQSSLTGAAPNRFDSMFAGNNVSALPAARDAEAVSSNLLPDQSSMDRVYGRAGQTASPSAAPSATTAAAPAGKTRDAAPPADQARYDRDFARAARPTTRDQVLALQPGDPFINPADGKLHYKKGGESTSPRPLLRF